MNTRDILQELDVEIARLREARRLLADTGSGKTRKAGRRVLSPEARERIAAAQRKRWSAQKQNSPDTKQGSAPKGERTGGRVMSPEARARIGAATKARWAAGKQGKQSRDRLRKMAAGARKAA